MRASAKVKTGSAQATGTHPHITVQVHTGHSDTDQIHPPRPELLQQANADNKTHNQNDFHKTPDLKG